MRKCCLCQRKALPYSKYCIFHEDVDKKDPNVVSRELIKAIENGESNFSKGRFSQICVENKEIKRLDFSKSEIKGLVVFKNNKIETIDFREARIKGDVVLENNVCYQIYFQKSDVEGSLIFRSIEAISIKSEYSTIKGELVLKDVKVPYIQFDYSKIEKVPIFEINAEGEKILEPSFENTKFGDPRSQERVCRKVRVIYEKAKDAVTADNYFYCEMVGKRKIKRENIEKNIINKLAKPVHRRVLAKEEKEKIVKRIYNTIVRFLAKICGRLYDLYEYLLVDFTCKYGTDWKRPIYLWGIAILVVFPLLYFLGNGIISPNDHVGFWESMYFSIVTATTLGYGDLQPKPGIFCLLAAVEAIFGMFMWAIFLTVLAHKYMRR